MLLSTTSAILLAPLVGVALGMALRDTPYGLGRRATRAGVPLSMTVVACWAALSSGANNDLWANCFLGWGLVALAWIDWHHLVLPDLLTLPLVVAGLAATAWLDPDQTTAHALGAAAGYGAFRLLAFLYQVVRDREGLGQGDAKMLAAAGAWLGWEPLSHVVLLAALLCVAWASARAAHQGAAVYGHPLPFGSFLAGATWVVHLHAIPVVVP